MRPIIPLIDPEVVKREAIEVYRGDYEKVPTTSARPFNYLNVTLSSRCDKAHEYELLMDLVEFLDEIDLNAIDYIYFDSKSDTIAIELCQCNCGFAKYLSEKIRDYFDSNFIWHSGIYISGAAKGQMYICSGYDVEF